MPEARVATRRVRRDGPALGARSIAGDRAARAPAYPDGQASPGTHGTPDHERWAVANIVNLDRVSKGYGAAGPLLTDVSLGLDDADRVGVVGLNGAGKSTLLRLLTRTEEPDDGRVTHRRDLRVAWLPQQSATWPPTPPCATWCSAPPGSARAWAPSTSGPATPASGPSSTASACPTSASTRPSARCPAGSAAGSRSPPLLVRDADLLVLDEPTNHLDVGGVDWLAGTWSPARARSSWSPTTAGSSTPSAPPPGRSPTRPSGRTRAGSPPGRLARVERERLAAADRGPPAEPAPQGDRLAAPRPAGAHLQAEVPHRRGQRAHRRRAGAARHRVELQRLATARLGQQVYDLEDVTLHAGPQGDPATTPPGRSGPATGSPSSASTAPARPPCCGCSPGDRAPDGGRFADRADRAAGVPLPGTRRAARPACGVLRGRRGGRPPGAVRRPGDQRGAARRDLRLRRQAALDAGRRPLRRRAAPAADAAAARWRAQRAAASTSPPTTWTPTPWPRWRTCSTPGPARSSWPATTVT